MILQQCRFGFSSIFSPIVQNGFRNCVKVHINDNIIVSRLSFQLQFSSLRTKSLRSKATHTLPVTKGIAASRFRFFRYTQNNKFLTINHNTFFQSLLRQKQRLIHIPSYPPIKRQQTAFQIAFKHAGREFVRFLTFLFISLLSIVIIGLLSWRGYHFYIEHFLYPTPTKLSRPARDCLRGAFIRTKISPDSHTAEIYLRQALQIILERDKLDLNDQIIIDILKSLGDNYVWRGNLEDAILQYRQILELLLQQHPSREGKEDLSEVIDIAKKLGDLYIRIQDYITAEKYLVWAIGLLQGNVIELLNEDDEVLENTSIFASTSLINKDFISITDLLAGLYAKQRKYDYALPLYLSLLKMIQEKESLKLKCWEAIINGHIGEIFFAMGKYDEALGWLQKGLSIAKNGDGNRDCDECAGVILNNLGLIHERRENNELAVSLYINAIEFAEKAQDFIGIEDFTKNLNRVRTREENSEQVSNETI
ncbi:8394_t:CDS:1 [Funneliformis caledonium]|uniref:8394_t:CDS:1 n=2 Tax=Funneliformis TaxID=1117308 RepID=A0A9N9A3M5_9GLOM|nr:8394_t:CDS:1 [Funneliformis caledonium]CAG8559871.1 1679_t:CDS:1 [Funneliformis mosseae]